MKMGQSENDTQILLNTIRENASLLGRLKRKVQEKNQDTELVNNCIVAMRRDDCRLSEVKSEAIVISDRYFLTNNLAFTEPTKIAPKGICVYASGEVMTAADMIHDIFNVMYAYSSQSVSVHAVINYEDGKIYQTLPWDFKGVHQFSERDNSYLGIVICEADACSLTNDPLKDTYETLVSLVAWLCNQYGIAINEENLILHNKEGEMKGIDAYWQDYYFGSDFFERVKEKMQLGISAEELKESYYAL